METTISMQCDSCSSFVQSCACTFLVLRCDVRYSFHIKTMFDSSLPPVVYRRVHVLQCFLCMLAHSYVQYFAVAHLCRFMCCVFFCVLCDQCCQFLWIIPSVFTNVNIIRVLHFFIFPFRIKRSGYNLARPFIKYGHCGSINHTVSDLGKDRYVFDQQ